MGLCCSDEGYQGLQLTRAGRTRTIRGRGGDANVCKCPWRYSGGIFSFRARWAQCAHHTICLPHWVLPGPSENKVKYLWKVCVQPYSDDTPATQITSSSQSIKMMHSRLWSYSTHSFQRSLLLPLCKTKQRSFFSERAAIIHSQWFGRNKWGIHHVRHGRSSIHMDYFAA